MEPSQPTPPGTSLELPETHQPPAVVEPATASEPSGPPSPGLLGNLVVTQFRQADTAMLGRLLIDTLTTALPASMVRVEGPRSLGRRLTRRPAEPTGIAVTAGDRTLSLRVTRGAPVEASIGHTVRGVVLSSTPVPVARWLDELGELLDRLARDDDATRAALEQALLS